MQCLLNTIIGRTIAPKFFPFSSPSLCAIPSTIKSELFVAFVYWLLMQDGAHSLEQKQISHFCSNMLDKWARKKKKRRAILCLSSDFPLMTTCWKTQHARPCSRSIILSASKIFKTFFFIACHNKGSRESNLSLSPSRTLSCILTAGDWYSLEIIMTKTTGEYNGFTISVRSRGPRRGAFVVSRVEKGPLFIMTSTMLGGPTAW